MFNGGVEVAEGFRKSILPVGDKAEQMKGLRVPGRHVECQPVGPFSIRQAAGLLMGLAFFES